MRRGATLATGLALLLGAAGAGGAPADVVTLPGGKSLRGTVFREGGKVRVNPFRATRAEMTWGVVEVEAAAVRGVAPEDRPADLLQALDALPPGDVAGRVALLGRAREARRREIAERAAEEILAAAPSVGEALAAVGGPAAWAARRAADPRLSPDLRRAWWRAVALPTAAERRAAVEAVAGRAGPAWSAATVERAARSLRGERGEVPESPLRLAAEPDARATYAAWVPPDLDPLDPRPLVLALHGGGGTEGRTDVVVGSGREALSLVVEGARRARALVVAPTALEWPWTTPKNEAFLEALLEEATRRWNVDLDRVHVVGQGEGADAALWFASRHAPRFATAGGAGARPGLATSLAQRDVGVWLHHGEKDEVVPVEEARKAATALRRADADFAYLELPGAGRGFPPSAEADWWAFAGPRRRARAPLVRPSPSFHVPPAAGADDDPGAAWRPFEGDAPAALGALRRGFADAEPAARRLLADRVALPAGAVAALAAVVADRSVPAEGRAWAAVALGELGDAAGLAALADAVRTETDPWLVGHLARALGALGSPDAVEDLRFALGDAASRWQRRSWPGGVVPAHEADRTCRVLADLVEALGGVGRDPELAADIEAAAVVGVLRDPRPVGPPAGPADPPGARARLALACGRAYRALGAEATLFDMLRVTLRRDPEATAAAARGAAEGLPRRGPAGR